MNDINKYSNFSIVLNRAELYFGNRRLILLKSTDPKRKFMVLHENEWIHFGRAGIVDFTKDFDQERRIKVREALWLKAGEKKLDKYHPISLALNILW